MVVNKLLNDIIILDTDNIIDKDLVGKTIYDIISQDYYLRITTELVFEEVFEDYPSSIMRFKIIFLFNEIYKKYLKWNSKTEESNIERDVKDVIKMIKY